MEVYIKEVAKKRGVNLITLAGRLGVTRQTLYYYCEQGDKNPVAQLEKIADAIGVPLTDLFVDPDAAPVQDGKDFIALLRENGETHTFSSRRELIDYVTTAETEMPEA